METEITCLVEIDDVGRSPVNDFKYGRSTFRSIFREFETGKGLVEEFSIPGAVLFGQCPEGHETCVTPVAKA
jgi:hypothetical protein